MDSSHFDEVAREYDESLPPHVVEHYLVKRARFVLERCPRGRGLDVGCGTGALVERLAAGGLEMTGVDPSAGMLELLRGRAPGVEAIQASGTALPLADDCFDVVLCVAVMHHIAEPPGVRQTLGEMVRVTRPGGLVVVWDHNPRNPYWRSLMRRVPQDTGEERLVPEEELVAGLEAAGAGIVASVQSGLVPDFVPPRLIGAAAAVERAVEATPGVRRRCAHNVVVARKPSGRTPAA